MKYSLPTARGAGLPLFLLLTACSATLAAARDWTVNSEADLRTALTLQTGAQSGDTIHIGANLTLSADLPPVQSSVTIDGTGHILSGGSQHRGLFVAPSSSGSAAAPAITVAINNLTITAASAVGGNGGTGDSLNGGGGGGAGMGAALFVGSSANVTLSNVVMNNNAATGGLGGNGGWVKLTNQPTTLTTFSGPGTVGGGSAGSKGGNGGGKTWIPGTGQTQNLGSASGAFGCGGDGGGASANPGSGGFGGGGGGGWPGTLNQNSFTGVVSSNDEWRPLNNAGFGAASGTLGSSDANNSGSLNTAGCGGAGAGLGGAIFVQQGGALTVAGPLAISGNSVSGGQGNIRVAGGQGIGSGIFLQGTGALTLAPAAGQTVAISDAIADPGGNGGTGGAAVVVNGLGTVALTGSNSYSGGTQVKSGTLLVSNGSGSGTGSGPVLVGPQATLAGTGRVAGNVILAPGAKFILGNSVTSSLNVGSMLWSGSASVVITIGAGGSVSLLPVNGPLLKGPGTGFQFVFQGAPPAHGTTYTVARFQNTNFQPGDFTFAGLPPEMVGVFSVQQDNGFVTFTVL